MKVSIILVNYNTFDLTSACIESLFKNTKGPETEIILIDNGSDDRDPKEFLTMYPGLHLIINNENPGFSKAVTQGISNANGEYILLINSDCKLINNAVDICSAFLDNHSDTGVVTCKLISSDGMIQHNCQRVPSVGTKLFELFRLQKVFNKELSGRILMGPYFQYDRVIYPDWVWGTFFMFRSELLNGLPGNKLSDRFFLYAEDLEWCLQFRRNKVKIAFEPSARVLHYSGKSGGDKEKYMRMNVNLLLNEYYNLPQKIIIKSVNFMLTGRYSYY